MDRFLSVAALILVLLAAGGPVGTYAAWKQQILVHRVQTEGIETNAEIVGGGASKYKGSVSYHLELKWTLKSGVQYSRKVGASGSYGAMYFNGDPFGSSGVVSNGSFRLTANTVPIKYLEADPSSVILHLDPANSDENQASELNRMAAVSAVGIGGTLLLFLLSYFLRPAGWGREVPQTAASPGELRHWLVLSIVLYAILAGIHFLPMVHAADSRFFGVEPYGIPVTVFAIAAGTILYLPVFWVFRQVVRIDAQRLRDGSWVPGVIYLLSGGWHRHLRGAVVVIWRGGLYVLALAAAGLTFAVNAPPPSGLASVDRIEINKAFPGAGHIAERLVQAGFEFDSGEDWFGPKDPGQWTIKIGAQVDEKIAQQIIAICKEEYGGDILISRMADPAAYKELNMVYIGALGPSPAPATGNVQPLQNPGIRAQDLRPGAKQQAAPGPAWLQLPSQGTRP